MPTEYVIHIQNQQNEKEKFWCFLSKPEAEYDADVFANSSTYLTVPLFTGNQDNYFTVPLQYIVSAQASSRVVGLKTKITSSNYEEADLGQSWDFELFTDNEGPVITEGEPIDDNTQLLMRTNKYNKNEEPLNNWYNSLTFGIKTENGFMGVTWSPKADQQYYVTPNFEFYISTGRFSENTLADITNIAASSATVTLKDFDGNRECTVVRTPNGEWEVHKGNLNQPTLLAKLLDAHASLISAHAAMVTMVAQKNNPDKESMNVPRKLGLTNGLGITHKEPQGEAAGEHLNA
ncbi:hypothetical protein P0E69_08695 [Chimaeribacter arupi]|uniref:hypothetical protein n=1 Tax=Chimaeribacter arupi TaxID=2060066 RepID=UPI002711F3B8|nr:hypothetical protein [Chimaeribacter arupi]WKZ93937.1 hypothetical protein P0E69_08695 [Chimaeribacter arupi]